MVADSHVGVVSEMSDTTLVERAKDGDTDAFSALVDRYQTPLFRLVSRIVFNRAEAEDVVQEAMVTAWRNVEQVRDPAKFRPWLFQIASNRALDVVRSNSRHPTSSLDADDGEYLAEPTGRGPEGQAIAHDQVQALARALQTLPPQQRASWLLREFDGFSYAEIAEILQVSEGAVRGQLARARIALVQGMTTWM